MPVHSVCVYYEYRIEQWICLACTASLNTRQFCWDYSGTKGDGF